MQLVGEKWCIDLKIEFKFQLLTNEKAFFPVCNTIMLKLRAPRMGKNEIVINTLVFQNVDASALPTRCYAPENINYVYLTKSVKVVNIHTKLKITRIKLHQNGLI